MSARRDGGDCHGFGYYFSSFAFNQPHPPSSTVPLPLPGEGLRRAAPSAFSPSERKRLKRQTPTLRKALSMHPMGGSASLWPILRDQASPPPFHPFSKNAVFRQKGFPLVLSFSSKRKEHRPPRSPRSLRAPRPGSGGSGNILIMESNIVRCFFPENML